MFLPTNLGLPNLKLFVRCSRSKWMGGRGTNMVNVEKS